MSMKKLVRIVVVAVVLALSINNVFYADEEEETTSEVYTEGNLQYTINGDDVSGHFITVLYYFGNETEYTIPWVIGVYEVKEISNGAFNSSNVSTLRVPESISVINPSSYKSGTTIIRYDAFGNETVLSNGNLDMVENQEEEKEMVEEAIDTSFEDQDIDLGDDVFEDEGTVEPRRTLRDFFLYNGRQFVSNFKSNPIGYLVIFVSVGLLIYLFIRWVRHN